MGKVARPGDAEVGPPPQLAASFMSRDLSTVPGHRFGEGHSAAIGKETAPALDTIWGRRGRWIVRLSGNWKRSAFPKLVPLLLVPDYWCPNLKVAVVYFELCQVSDRQFSGTGFEYRPWARLNDQPAPVAGHS
jgi:hypothetical protein